MACSTSGGRSGWCGSGGLFGGFAYLLRCANTDVAILVWVKASGAFVWGPADILNGR